MKQTFKKYIQYISCTLSSSKREKKMLNKVGKRNGSNPIQNICKKLNFDLKTLSPGSGVDRRVSG